MPQFVSRQLTSTVRDEPVSEVRPLTPESQMIPQELEAKNVGGGGVKGNNNTESRWREGEDRSVSFGPRGLCV